MKAISRAWGTRCCAADLGKRLTRADADRLGRLLRLLADPIRLQILDILARRGGQVCVCDLMAGVPVKQPTISHHLKLLKQAGIIGSERRGQWTYYFIRPEARRDVRACFGRCFGAMTP